MKHTAIVSEEKLLLLPLNKMIKVKIELYI